MTSSSRSILAVLLLGLALGLCQGCISGPPHSAKERGERAFLQGNWRSAKKYFAEALRLEATDGRAWLGQARAQLLGRDAEGTLRSLSSLAKVDPDRFHGEARKTYLSGLEGAVRQRLGRRQSEAALQAVRALAELDPDRNGLSRLLGLSLMAEGDRLRLIGDRDRALLLFREANQAIPHSLDAWVAAAEILIERGDGKRAMQLLKAARKSHPTAGAIRMLTLQVLQMRSVWLGIDLGQASPKCASRWNVRAGRALSAA
ncbi:MAG: hypothetical protein CL933_11135 [Deltaproteobacteria bacterium]|nr:hypothetical protein [Deltaproteobacteria bacterium]